MSAHPPVRFGILSTAGINRALLPAFAASEWAELVAVSSRDQAKLDRWCAEHDIADSVTRHDSYEALLADERVEAIYNPLPNALHAEWTIRAAEAGKHILCEKPLAANVAECRAMIDAAEQHGVTLMEAFMYRHHPATKQYRADIESGAIGDLRHVHAAFCFGLSDDPANIRLSAELAGGALMDVGCYCVSMTRHLTGEEPTTAYAVAQFGERSGVDETLVGTLNFPSGAVGTFVCSIKAAGRSGVAVLGSKGNLDIDSPWFANPDRQVYRRNGEEVVVEGGGNPYQLEVEALAKHVRTGEPLYLPPIDGARTVAVIVALLESARTEAPVAVERV